MKRETPAKPLSHVLTPVTTAAAVAIALSTPAMAEDTAKARDLGGEEKAEDMAEHAARDGSAKTQPKESWMSGASTSDPSPNESARPAEALPATAGGPPDRDNRNAEVAPVPDGQLDKVVEEAQEDNKGRTKPKESWTSGASTVDFAAKDDPADD